MVIERGTGNVQFYDASTYEITDSLQLPRGAPTAAHYIDSMKAIVFGFGDTVMGVWDLNRDSKTFKQVGGNFEEKHTDVLNVCLRVVVLLLLLSSSSSSSSSLQSICSFFFL